jgi:hypothetical protein
MERFEALVIGSGQAGTPLSSLNTKCHGRKAVPQCGSVGILPHFPFTAACFHRQTTTSIRWQIDFLP